MIEFWRIPKNENAESRQGDDCRNLAALGALHITKGNGPQFVSQECGKSILAIMGINTHDATRFPCKKREM